MTRPNIKKSSINTDDPEDIETYALATTSSGGLIAEEVHPGIHVIKNALTEDEITYLRNFCESTDDEGWKASYKSSLKLEAIELYGEDNLEEIKNYIEQKSYEYKYWIDKCLVIEDSDFCLRLHNRVKPFFGDRYSISGFPELHRQRPGEGMHQHHDGGGDPGIRRSAIFYINGDFSGGELYFPALDFEYKPEAGDFVTFPAYEKYTHGVNTVKPGPDRYVLAGFAWKA